MWRSAIQTRTARGRLRRRARRLGRRRHPLCAAVGEGDRRATRHHQHGHEDRDRGAGLPATAYHLPGGGRLSAITIDCADPKADPKALAGFYQKVTGWQITHSDDDTAYLGDGPIQLAFQRVDEYRGPGWPARAKHAHLDFTVADVEVAAKELVALGASRPAFQPGGDQWTVLTDPEGHPFCIAAG